MDLDRLTRLFELISYLVVVLGVPVALFQYLRSQTREREERERQIFDAVSASYVDFQLLALERPYLDVFDIPDSEPVALTPLQAKEELIAFAVLLSIFERAYLLYLTRPTPITTAQWREWDVHIRGYFRRGNFRCAWSLGASSYDPRFVAYMHDVERAVTAEAAPTLAPPTAIGASASAGPSEL